MRSGVNGEFFLRKSPNRRYILKNAAVLAAT